MTNCGVLGTEPITRPIITFHLPFLFMSRKAARRCLVCSLGRDARVVVYAYYTQNYIIITPDDNDTFQGLRYDYVEKDASSFKTSSTLWVMNPRARGHPPWMSPNHELLQLGLINRVVIEQHVTTTSKLIVPISPHHSASLELLTQPLNLIISMFPIIKLKISQKIRFQSNDMK